jgi:histidine triad (HIT) family protein
MSMCGFCDILAGEAPAEIVPQDWDDVVVIRPRSGGVAEGHVLVVPRVHVQDAGQDPEVTAVVMRRAAELVAQLPDANLITSKGANATQTFPRGREPVVHCRGRWPYVPVPDSSRRGVPHTASVSDIGREARR